MAKKTVAKKLARQRNQPRSKGRPSAASPEDRKLQRLNKVLAAAGFGSRREVEELIVQGRVEVDREIVTKLACKVDPREVEIKVDGQLVKRFRPVYFMLNKPKGVLSTNKDPSGRIRVVDFVPDNQRVFSVGRLDKSSEGLMLLTNDGELAQKLAHPKYRVQKTYFVVVAGVMSKEELAKLRKGVYLSEGFARIDGATIRAQRKASTELEIVLSEGKNREIRRILARAGHKVLVLKRIAIGPLRLGQLPVGTSRPLTSAEINALKKYSPDSPRKKQKQKPKAADSSSTKRKESKQDNQAETETNIEYTDLEPFSSAAEEQSTWNDDDFSDVLAAVEQDSFPMDDEFGHEIDDDFVTSSAGSVLAYDEDDETEPQIRKKPTRSHRGRGPSRSTSRQQAAASSSTRGNKGKSKRAASPARPNRKKAARGEGGGSSGSSRNRTSPGKKSSSKRKTSKKANRPTSSRHTATAKSRNTNAKKSSRGKRGRG